MSSMLESPYVVSYNERGLCSRCCTGRGICHPVSAPPAWKHRTLPLCSFSLEFLVFLASLRLCVQILVPFFRIFLFENGLGQNWPLHRIFQRPNRLLNLDFTI